MITNVSQKISFGTTPLYDVQLKQVTPNCHMKFVPAKFSRLVPVDKGDVFAVKEIGKEARKNKETILHHIANIFSAKTYSSGPCYALELVDDTKPLKDRIVALVNTEVSDQGDKSVLKIKYLARNNDVADTKDGSIIGAGEVSVYGVVKIAKEDLEDDVELISKETAMDFYERIGFEKEKGPRALEFRDYFLDSKDYNFFIKNVEEKYGFENK